MKTTLRNARRRAVRALVGRDRIFYLVSFVLLMIVLFPLWVPLATGIVLAYVCEGPANSVLQRLGWHSRRTRWLVSIGLVSLVQILFIAPLVFLTFSAAQELVAIWNRWVQGSTPTTGVLGGQISLWLTGHLNALIERFDLPISAADIGSRLRDFLEPVLKVLASTVGRLLTSTPELLLFLLISWMAWVYFLAEGKEHRRSILPMLIPWPRQRALVSSTLGDVLRQMVLASVALAIVQSLLVTISLAVAGVPKFMLWGALSFFLSFVPIVGTFPVLGASAAYLYAQGSNSGALLLIVASVGIGLSDNLLRPFLMRGSSEISFFWLFLSLLGGVAMFGLPGVILGPWFVTLFIAVHRQATERTSS